MAESMPWRISLDYSYANANQLIQGSVRQDDKETSLGVRNRHQTTLLGVSYDFTSRLTAGISVPYVYNERWKDYINVYYSGEGIGDTTLFGRYWLKQERDAFNTYVELALSLPTGESDQKFTDPTTHTTLKPNGQNSYKESYITPGMGVYVPIIAVGFDKKILERTSLFGRAQFMYPIGKNNAEYEASTPLSVTMGTTYTFIPAGRNLFGVSGQFNYVYDQFRQDKRYGTNVGNTGGEWLDFEPGAWYSPDGGRLIFTVSVPYGLYYHVNSLQTNAPWTYNVGVSYRF